MPVIEGLVQHGDGRGRELGFPTANIPVTGPERLDGVWAGTVEVSPGWRAVAAISIGCRTTFYAEHGDRLLEAHALDFAGDLYGLKLRVNLISRLRPQITYMEVDALVEQLQVDVLQVRDWASGYCPWLLSSPPQDPPYRTPS